jgi:hypothetical protein
MNLKKHITSDLHKLLLTKLTGTGTVVTQKKIIVKIVPINGDAAQDNWPVPVCISVPKKLTGILLKVDDEILLSTSLNLNLET